MASQPPSPQLQADLLAWFAANARDLPWRRTRDPYHILVSEVMLQQTQVDRVIPKYLAFLAAFPTLEALAAAPTAEVIRLWAGLGYNRRAVNLQRSARAIVDGRDGQFPRSVEALRALPGIGPYTAGAVACFAFEQDVAFLDTNIRRVLRRALFGPDSRWQAPLAPDDRPFGSAQGRQPTTDGHALPTESEDQLYSPPAGAGPAAAGAQTRHPPPAAPAGKDISRSGTPPPAPPSDRTLLEHGARLIPPGQGWAWGQAIMELGALICTATAPACWRCPISARCSAYAELRAADEALMDALALGATPAPPRKRAAERREESYLGSRRYHRGKLIDALRSAPDHTPLTLAQLGPLLKPDFAAADMPWLLDLAQSLARDGLLALDGDVVRLPG